MPIETEIAKNVLRKEAESILRASERIGSEVCKAVKILFSEDNKIIVCGIGKSGHLGKKMSATFCSTGSPSAFLHPSEAVHGDLGIHQNGDPVIFISNSGTTPELLALEPVLRKRNAKIIGILGRSKSELSKKVDVAIDASVSIEADPLGIVPTASFAVAAALGDALASALMEKRNFSEKDYAITHPSGQLGRNLLLKVSDVMHSTDKIAQIKSTTSFKETVVEMTRFPLGAACVMDGEDILGIITDGDLRRTLQKTDDFISIKSKNVMVTNPITIEPSFSLHEALQKMEKRKSPISVLPVTEKGNHKLLGLIRLHDIYDPTVK
tara:strand:- start:1498 stop:2469 length:972 start_codon:yes stop_codon:yes gene_type:complete